MSPSMRAAIGGHRGGRRQLVEDVVPADVIDDRLGAVIAVKGAGGREVSGGNGRGHRALDLGTYVGVGAVDAEQVPHGGEVGGRATGPVPGRQAMVFHLLFVLSQRAV